MKEQATKALHSVQTFWKSQTKKKKIIFLSVIGAILVLAIVLTAILNHKDYSVLYTGLDTKEAAEILGEIQTMEIDAQMKSNGSILVDKAQADQVRMTLATKGYPKSSLSYDYYTKNVDMFTTDSQKKEIAKQQLQNRLQATIETLKGIDEAIVTLDIPEKSNTVITTGDRTPSASVVLHLNTDVKLSNEQIKGVTRIVMKSVSGMSEEDVSITDGTGKLLIVEEGNEKDTSDLDSMVLNEKRMKYKKSFETQLANQVREFLTPSYGENGVNVVVSATFDYDKKVSEDTHYTPSVGDNGMVKDEETEESEQTGNGKKPEVGANPNADGTYPTAEDDEETTSWSSRKTKKNFLVNELKEQTEKNGVYVEKVTASVMVYTDEISDEHKQTIVQGVANAVGTTADLVSVGNLPKYVEPEVEQPDDKDTKFGFTKDELIIFAIAAGVLLIALIVTFIITSKKSKKKKKKAEKLRKMQIEAEQKAIEEAKKEEEESENKLMRSLTDKVPETKEVAIRKELGDFVETSPEIAAQLLKSWIYEEGE